ncbi:MAG: hypothetical protein AAF599_18020, partial [Bacteroidota bacterium]
PVYQTTHAKIKAEGVKLPWVGYPSSSVAAASSVCRAKILMSFEGANTLFLFIKSNMYYQEFFSLS